MKITESGKMLSINSKHKFTFSHEYGWGQIAYLTCLNRITTPRVLHAVGWLISMAVLIVILMLVFVPWVQTTTGAGKVTTLDPRDRVQDISALVSGRIAQWYVKDADFVKAGDPIVRIQDVADDYVSRLQAQLDAATRKLAAARQAGQTAELDLVRQEQLFKEGLTSRLDFEQAGIRVQQMRISEEQALADLNEAEVTLSRQGSQLVVAPRDGTILHVQAGDTATIVSAGQSLATFMPANTERAVEIYIDGRDIGLVQPGRQVRVEFEGWPAFQFSGIPEYAVGTFAAEVVFVEPNAFLDGSFRVLVKERPLETACVAAGNLPGMNLAGNCGWPPESFIRLGGNVRGWILLETVPLGYELWRQLNNFPPVNKAALDRTNGPAAGGK